MGYSQHSVRSPAEAYRKIAKREFDLLADLTADTSLKVGDKCKTAEREAGKEGGAEHTVISGTGTANGRDIIAHDTLSLSVVLKSEPLPSVAQWGSFGGATDETTIWQAIIDAGVRHVTVPYNAAGYTINALTNTNGTTFMFQGNSPMNGAQALSGLGVVLDEGSMCGIPTCEELRDKRIEVVSGTIRQQQPRAITGIARTGTTAVITQTDHGYAVGDYIVIRGATPTGYNGTHEVAQVDSTSQYRVVVDSGLSTPPTGSITSFGADVWEWIKDSTHEPVGVDDSTPVRSDASGYGLLIPFSKTYTKVLSVVATPDETIAGASAMVLGSSVSNNACAIRASLNKTVAGNIYWNSGWGATMGTDQGSVYTTNAPYPFDDINYTGGNLTLNHSFCLGSDLSLTAHSRGGAVTPLIPIIKSVSDNETVVNFLHVSGGALALYTGAASTSLSLQYTKRSNRLIKFDGSDRSSETGLYFGNIWFFGIMQV